MTTKIVKTDDGSSTFFNEKFKQCYHSQVGAYTEALEKHVKPSKVLEIANKSLTCDDIPNIKLLDVCFGLGYNTGVAIEKILELNPNIFVEVIALENDIEILKQIAMIDVPENYQRIHRELSLINKFIESKALEDLYKEDCSLESNGIKLYLEKNKKTNFNLIIQSKSFRITILLGDARKRILDIEDSFFNAVFFDPFSPKECPELWTIDFISAVVGKSKAGAYISTYSSARVVKDNFAKAGCEIFEGPKLNRRSGGVLAKKAT